MKKSRINKKAFGYITDLIRAGYVNVGRMSIKPRAPESVREMCASLTARGLGDCMMLTDLPRAARSVEKTVHVWSGADAFYDVMRNNPYYRVERDCGTFSPFLVDVLRLHDTFELGNGHLLQQLRRTWGLPVDIKPIPCLKVDNVISHPRRVILHFEPAVGSSTQQRKYLHRRMRELYWETQVEIERFISSHPDYEFVEVGKSPKRLKGSIYFPTSNLPELFNVVASGTFFLGIMSGPLHVATACGLKVITIVNYPSARQLVMPNLRNSNFQEFEWMYPQHVHLHQDDSAPLVPRLTADSLSAALSGDVYPFWRDDWLHLINEK